MLYYTGCALFSNENEGGLPVTAGVTVTVDFESRRKGTIYHNN